MQATRWMRELVAESFSLIFLLERVVRTGGVDPYALRQAFEAAVVRVKYDDRARGLGFTPEHLRRVRLALIATADEITQRPGSRVNYSAPEPPIRRRRARPGPLESRLCARRPAPSRASGG